LSSLGVITGAASGMGRAITAALRRQTPDAQLVEWDLTAENPVDVSDSSAVNAAAAALDGPVDFAVLAAGVSRMAPITGTSDEDWNVQMNVNAFGAFACIRALVPRMRDGGSFVIIDSCGGLRAAPLLSAYCASKFAVTGLIEAAAPELATRLIRINGIAPMYVRTPMQSRELSWEAELRGTTPETIFAEYERTTPLGRVAEPEDVADVALYLLSDASRYLTGTIVTVSGGAHLGFTYDGPALPGPTTTTHGA
jgi:meso-butanediol dehydrogenase/(S,S)-butanediol dehydrogenase/diacetyl reductase